MMMVLSVASRRGCKWARSSGSPLQITVMSDSKISRHIRLPICISFNFYMRERGFLYPSRVLPLFMPYHLLEWSFGNRQAFLRDVESISATSEALQKKTNKGYVSLFRVSCDCKGRESLITRSTFCCQAVEATLLRKHNLHDLQSPAITAIRAH